MVSVDVDSQRIIMLWLFFFVFHLTTLVLIWSLWIRTPVLKNQVSHTNDINLIMNIITEQCQVNHCSYVYLNYDKVNVTLTLFRSSLPENISKGVSWTFNFTSEYKVWAIKSHFIWKHCYVNNISQQYNNAMTDMYLQLWHTAQHGFIPVIF